MFKLIKREIMDMRVFFLLTALFSLFIAFMPVLNMTNNKLPAFGVPDVIYAALGLFPLLYLSFFGIVLGIVQVHTDNSKKISSYLATLAITRRQIFTAKFISGLIWCLLVIVPIAFTDWVLLNMYPQIALPDADFFIGIFICWFLCGLTCYCLGLQLGGCSGKLLPLAGIILITPLVMSLIIIKGINSHTIVIYTILIFASFIRAWNKFIKASL